MKKLKTVIVLFIGAFAGIFVSDIFDYPYAWHYLDILGLPPELKPESKQTESWEGPSIPSSELWPRELALKTIENKEIEFTTTHFNPHLFGTHMLFLYELSKENETYYEIKFEIPGSRSLGLSLITLESGYVRTKDWYNEEGELFRVHR